MDGGGDTKEQERSVSEQRSSDTVIRDGFITEGAHARSGMLMYESDPARRRSSVLAAIFFEDIHDR